MVRAATSGETVAGAGWGSSAGVEETERSAACCGPAWGIVAWGVDAGSARSAAAVAGRSPGEENTVYALAPRSPAMRPAANSAARKSTTTGVRARGGDGRALDAPLMARKISSISRSAVDRSGHWAATSSGTWMVILNFFPDAVFGRSFTVAPPSSVFKTRRLTRLRTSAKTCDSDPSAFIPLQPGEERTVGRICAPTSRAHSYRPRLANDARPKNTATDPATITAIDA